VKKGGIEAEKKEGGNKGTGSSSRREFNR